VPPAADTLPHPCSQDELPVALRLQAQRCRRREYRALRPVPPPSLPALPPSLSCSQGPRCHRAANRIARVTARVRARRAQVLPGDARGHHDGPHEPDPLLRAPGHPRRHLLVLGAADHAPGAVSYISGSSGRVSGPADRTD
jgi:hypothetical protein